MPRFIVIGNFDNGEINPASGLKGFKIGEEYFGTDSEKLISLGLIQEDAQGLLPEPAPEYYSSSDCKPESEPKKKKGRKG